MSKRGRKPIGDRRTFNCPDDLFDYVDSFTREANSGDWAAKLRWMISDHMKLRKTVSKYSHEFDKHVM